jgi:hypothetical protein
MRRNQISSFARNGRVHLNMTSHAQKPDFVFRAKRTSPFKLARWEGVSSVDCWPAEVCGISGSNATYTVFRGSVKGTGYPLHWPVSPFTSPSLRHRVPSHFNWTLPTLNSYLQLLESTHTDTEFWNCTLPERVRKCQLIH